MNFYVFLSYSMLSWDLKIEVFIHLRLCCLNVIDVYFVHDTDIDDVSQIVVYFVP